jgi:magnesium transporter
MSIETTEAVERVWELGVREEGQILRQGPEFAAYRVIDAITDSYFDVLTNSKTKSSRSRRT